MDKVTESQIGILDDNSDVAATWAALDGLSKHLTKLCRTKNILVTSSGTAAIHLAYLAVGLKKDDEINF